MDDCSHVQIKYYRWEGRFLFLRIKERCKECDLTYAVLNRLITGPFGDKPVTLKIAPWLNNWWRIIWCGAWHAPIVMVNGRVHSQGVVPDVPGLIRAAAAQLHDAELAARAETYANRKPSAEPAKGAVVYFSPACPHCHQLMAYLDANGIQYEGRDVTQLASARDEIRQLTGKLTIPVMVTDGGVVTGFDRKRIRDLLGIQMRDEKEGEAASARIPRVSADDLTSAMETARSVLSMNCTDGRTRASQHLYPHQWNWDAGFVARGYLHFDPEQAYREIRLLFEGQWSDGYLPHIIFNEQYLDHFPGADYWQAERSGRVPPAVHTSGISQPPVHASMLVAALELDPDKERARGFLRDMYPRISKLHDFFFTCRDPAGETLVYLVHPWESGIDNAPIWDEPLSTISDSSPCAKEMQARYDELAEKGKRPKRSYIEKYS